MSCSMQHNREAARLTSWRDLFSRRPSVIGMIHVRSLPGTPAYGGCADAVVQKAVEEAAIYCTCGVDGLLIENMHDTPYMKGDAIGPEIVAWMTRVGLSVRDAVGPKVPIGLQILAGGNRQALAAAHAAGLDFVRVEGYVYAHVADEGWIESCAGDLLRYRRQIGAEKLLIMADIKKKHSSHAVTADVSIVETAKAAALFRADAVIVTGLATGCPVDVDEMNLVLFGSTKKNSGKYARSIPLPLVLGSGVTIDNCEDYVDADGWIVGSWFKEDGEWINDLDPERISAFMAKARKLQKSES